MKGLLTVVLLLAAIQAGAQPASQARRSGFEDMSPAKIGRAHV